MGSTRDLLHDDEEVLADVRPHPVVVIGPVLLLVVAAAGAATIAIRYPEAPVAVAWVLAAMVVLPALWVLARVLRWRSARFTVTTGRLLYRRGVVGRDVVQLRLQRVAEVHCSQSLGGRLIGCGRLVFEVAGGDGPLVVEDVPWPRRLQRVVNAQLDRFDLPYWSYGGPPPGYGGRAVHDAYAGAPTVQAQVVPPRAGGTTWDQTASTATTVPGRPAGPTGPGRPTGPTGSTARRVPPGTTGRTGPIARQGPRGGRSRSWTDTPPRGVLFDDDLDGTIPMQILQLDELRRRGILSEEEFAAKKAELLDRL